MAVMSFKMATIEVSESHRVSTGQSEWSGIGWNDSSWELLQGLDVVEDLSLDAWPPQDAQVTQPAALA